MQTTGGLSFSGGFGLVPPAAPAAPTPTPATLKYWLNRTAVVTGALGTNRSPGMIVDYDDNVYLAGPANRISRLDSAGNTVWQKAAVTANHLALDQTGVYLAGNTAPTTSGMTGTEAYIAKYDNTGAMTWQQTLGQTTAQAQTGVSGDMQIEGSLTATALDAQGGIVVAGQANSGSVRTSYAYLARLSVTDGSVLWKTSWNANIVLDSFIDSQSNIFVTGANYVAKYNLSGTRLAGCTLGISSAQIQDVVTDSTGNVYVAVTNTAATTSNIVKLSNDLSTILWQKSISTPIYHMTLDSSDNIFYVGSYIGAYGSPGHESVYVLKTNTAGTIAFQRVLSYYYQNQTVRNGAIYLDGADLYISAEQYVGTDNLGMVLKLPSDGSLTLTSYPPVSLVAGNDRYDYSGASFTFTDITGGSRYSVSALSSTGGADVSLIVAKTRSPSSSDSSRPYTRHLTMN